MFRKSLLGLVLLVVAFAATMADANGGSWHHNGNNGGGWHHNGYRNNTVFFAAPLTYFAPPPVVQFAPPPVQTYYQSSNFAAVDPCQTNGFGSGYYGNTFGGGYGGGFSGGYGGVGVVGVPVYRGWRFHPHVGVGFRW